MNIETELAGLRADSTSPVLRTAVELGVGIVDGYRLFDSPIGEVVVSFNVSGVSSVDTAEGDPISRFERRFARRLVPAEPPDGWDRKIGRAIERGRPGDLPVDLRSVTTFQRRVLEQAATIPRGQIRPYGWLAARIGKAGAVRAVGSTMARNPIPLIVPCHRVVRSDGTIGAYSLGGAANKIQLLTTEGVDLERVEDLARRGVRYLASDTTGIFCLPTCAHARRITERHLVEIRSADAAHAGGFRPCKDCRPA